MEWRGGAGAAFSPCQSSDTIPRPGVPAERVLISRISQGWGGAGRSSRKQIKAPRSRVSGAANCEGLRNEANYEAVLTAWLLVEPARTRYSIQAILAQSWPSPGLTGNRTRGVACYPVTFLGRTRQRGNAAGASPAQVLGFRGQRSQRCWTEPSAPGPGIFFKPKGVLGCLAAWRSGPRRATRVGRGRFIRLRLHRRDFVCSPPRYRRRAASSLPPQPAPPLPAGRGVISARSRRAGLAATGGGAGGRPEGAGRR